MAIMPKSSLSDAPATRQLIVAVGVAEAPNDMGGTRVAAQVYTLMCTAAELDELLALLKVRMLDRAAVAGRTELHAVPAWELPSNMAAPLFARKPAVSVAPAARIIEKVAAKPSAGRRSRSGEGPEGGAKKWLTDHGWKPHARGRLSAAHLAAYQDRRPAPGWKPAAGGAEPRPADGAPDSTPPAKPTP